MLLILSYHTYMLTSKSRFNWGQVVIYELFCWFVTWSPLHVGLLSWTALNGLWLCFVARVTSLRNKQQLASKSRNILGFILWKFAVRSRKGWIYERNSALELHPILPTPAQWTWSAQRDGNLSSGSQTQRTCWSCLSQKASWHLQKRSVVLSTTVYKDQNSWVLDFLEAKGERACRKFFYLCLKLAEPKHC